MAHYLHLLACDATGSPLRSLNKNELCGLDEYSEGTFTLEGLTPLCEAFAKMPSLTSVRCAAREWDSARHPRPCFWPRPGRSACARSLGMNEITHRGKDMSAVIKLAEVLPQTSITTLRCAAPDSERLPHIPSCSQ